MTVEQRYQAAIAKIGGPAGLLRLPEDVKNILKETIDLETKTEMLEAIAEEVKHEGHFHDGKGNEEHDPV